MIITLLSDFGTVDHYVAAMKGVILSLDPSILLVDISHDVPAHDIRSAAYLLAACRDDFPPGTVNLTVVDPGVGSSRLPIVSRADGRLYVGPDNGVFSLVWSQSASVEVWRIERRVPGVRSGGSTFHGRDIFAPVAAAISRGLPPEKMGPSVRDPVVIRTPSVVGLPGGGIRGEIIHIDRFGNCVTSIRNDQWSAEHERSMRLRIGSESICRMMPFYSAAPDKNPFVIVGSAGFLEIAVREGSAAGSLGIQIGETLVLES